MPRITRVDIAWPSLRGLPRLALALRINAHPGPFAHDDANARALAELARELISTATAHGIDIAEFQIDFDAATAKLSGYRTWLETLRAAVAPVPLVFTALPAWLSSSEFPRLARAADGFVLQVHSLERPRDATTPFVLCDPASAQIAITRAARAGRPFRVALPTYGYALAFDPTGRFVALSAEGPRPEWREGFSIREVRADPVALAGLNRSLTTERPAALNGIIWYRLPVAGDTLNWSWPTLAAVMAGRMPAPTLQVEARPDATGLVELYLINSGDGDFSGPVRLAARWSASRAVAADALGAFSITTENAGSLHFAASDCRLPAHARQPVGWLRLSSTTTVPDVFLEN